MTDRPTGCPTLQDLNVKLTEIEKIAPFELGNYVRGAYYAETLGEFPRPDPPTITVDI